MGVAKPLKPIGGVVSDGTSDEEEGGQPPDRQKALGVLKFAMIAYFLVCGGPFGVEYDIEYGGPLLSIVSCFVLPICWSIPQVLMTAEMSTMLPDNGGYVVWTQAAFGDMYGLLSGVNGLFSVFIDLSIYPGFFVNYITSVVNLSAPLKILARAGFCFVSLLLNLTGVDGIGTASGFFAIAVLSPFFVYFLYTIDEAHDKHNWTHFDEKEVQWGVFASTMLWSFTGWDTLGTMAGEIADARRTFFFGTLVTIIMVMATYLLPLYSISQLHPNTANWSSDDAMLQFFDSDVGSWLHIWGVVASCIAVFGMYNSELASNALAMWALGGGDKSSEMPVAHLPRVLGRLWPRFGSPYIAVLVNTLIVFGFTFFDFSTLIQADMSLSCVRLLLEFSAFLKLRHMWPDRDRPFKVPWGWFGAILITIPKVAVVIFVLVEADLNTWIILGAVNVATIIYFLIMKKFTNKYTYPRNNLWGVANPRLIQWPSWCGGAPRGYTRLSVNSTDDHDHHRASKVVGSGFSNALSPEGDGDSLGF